MDTVNSAQDGTQPSILNEIESTRSQLETTTIQTSNPDSEDGTSAQTQAHAQQPSQSSKVLRDAIQSFQEEITVALRSFSEEFTAALGRIDEKLDKAIEERRLAYEAEVTAIYATDEESKKREQRSRLVEERMARI